MWLDMQINFSAVFIQQRLDVHMNEISEILFVELRDKFLFTLQEFLHCCKKCNRDHHRRLFVYSNERLKAVGSEESITKVEQFKFMLRCCVSYVERREIRSRLSSRQTNNLEFKTFFWHIFGIRSHIYFISCYTKYLWNFLFARRSSQSFFALELLLFSILSCDK